MGPYAMVDYNIALCRFQHMYSTVHGQPYAKVDPKPYARVDSIPPVRDLRFGLCCRKGWCGRSNTYGISQLIRGYSFEDELTVILHLGVSFTATYIS
jgi:hypothetical protein